MTAVDVIKEIEALAPEERAEVLRFLHEIETKQVVEPIDDHTFKAAADRVFERHAELFRKLAS